MERELIGSVELDKTKGGKPVVSLYSTDTRLAFPVLRLFDVSALQAVGIDPDGLGTERVHKRFWAYYTESEKENAQGHRYKDIEYLEPMDKPASATSADTSALLAELRAIRELLTVMAEAQLPADWAERAEAQSLDAALPRYENGQPVSDNATERESFAAYVKLEGQPPASVDALREWFKAQNGQNGN